jgi:hypothetical protein
MISLGKLAKKYGEASDEELQAKIEALRAERRTLARENRGPFPEDVHARFDQLIAEARVALDAGLAQVAAGALMLTPNQLAPGRSLVELASLDRVANDAAFQAKLRVAIDAATPSLSKAKVEAQQAKFDSEIATLETEIRRREVDRRRAAAEAELSELGAA